MKKDLFITISKALFLNILIFFVIFLFLQIYQHYKIAKNQNNQDKNFSRSVIESFEFKDIKREMGLFETNSREVDYKIPIIKNISRAGLEDDGQFQNEKTPNKQQINNFGFNFDSVKCRVSFVKRSAKDAQSAILKSVMGFFGGSNFILMSNMLFGKIEDLPKELDHSFKITGMLHIVAASGFNIGLIGLLPTLLNSHFGRFKQFIIWFFCILFYVLMTDLSLPLLRAFLTAFFAKLGQKIFLRIYHNLIVLAMASFLFFVLNWQTISNVSFQLSVGASLGLILVMPIWGGQTRGSELDFLGSKNFFLNKKDLLKLTPQDILGQFLRDFTKQSFFSNISQVFKESFQTTLVAQLFTLPIILVYFGELSLLSLIANTLLLWLTPIITIGFLCFLLISPLFLIFSSARKILQISALYLEIPVNLFTRVVLWFSQFEWTLLEINGFTWGHCLLWWVGVGSVIFYLHKKHVKKLRKTSLVYSLDADLGKFSYLELA